jgi:ABC-type multidrug transport system fused ATPase/permease subunit
MDEAAPEMTRWLLNTFPTWALALIIIGTFVALASAGLWLVPRLLPDVVGGEVNEIAGVMAGVIAAVYGVFLAFAVVVLYEEFHESRENVQAEAGALARLVRNSEALPAAASTWISTEVRAYRDAVVDEEWAAMRHGGDSPEAWRRLNRVYAALRGHEPRGERATAFYNASVTAIDDLVEARRARLNDAESELPGTFMVLLVGGAVLTLCFPLVFGVPHRTMHALMSLSLAVLLGFCLLVAIVLDHPFSGDVTVSSAPYHQGALAPREE